MSNSSHESGDHHNQAGLLAFIFSMAFCFAFFFYIVFIHPGVDLKENIKAPEVTGPALEKAVDVSKISDPWKSNPDMVAYGQKIFSQNCSMCHGEKGLGDGAAGAALNPKPRNLVEGPWKKGGGFVGLFKVLQGGIAGSSMASYSHLKVVDRWALVQFIDSITKAKVKEDPATVEQFARSAK